MTNRMTRPTRVFRVRRAATVATTGAAAAAVLAVGTPAVAQDDQESQQPPGYVEPEIPEVDPDAAGLMLGDGATLAEPRVVDIKFVVETLPSDSGGAGEDQGSGDGGDGGSDGGDEEEATEPSGPSGGQREEQTAGQHKFTLQTDVLFAEGSDEVTEEARAALTEIAAAIDEAHPPEVNVFGFTDNQGSYESGVRLSENRANNTYDVLRELIENPEGIVFNVRGYSEDYPLYDNSTEEGRRKNRRVEISWPTER